MTSSPSPSEPKQKAPSKLSKAAIVTGASSGIGLEAVRRLIVSGYPQHPPRRREEVCRRLETKASCRNLPLHEELMKALEQHRAASAYNKPNRWVFASTMKNGQFRSGRPA